MREIRIKTKQPVYGTAINEINPVVSVRIDNGFCIYEFDPNNIESIEVYEVRGEGFSA